MNVRISGLIALFFISLLSPTEAFSPAAYPKPKISAADAMEKATAFTKDKIDPELHYIDRVWLGKASGFPGLVWIVSFSPDGTAGKPSAGWFFVVVDQEGKASELSGSVQGSPPSLLEFKPPTEASKK